MRTLASSTPRKAPKLLQPLTLVAALIIILATSSLGWADSCSTVSLKHGAVTCTVPETNPELTSTITLTDVTFKAQATGMVLLYDNIAHTVLSDVVIFTNTPAGVATVTFLSDTDGVLVLPPNLPILGSFSEGSGPVFISVALGNGNFLNTKICSDMEVQNCNGTSDSIRLSEGTTSVPEPGTLLLLGSGLLGSGALKLSAGSLRRRLLRRTQS